jgi:hypothetical protein
MQSNTGVKCHSLAIRRTPCVTAVCGVQGASKFLLATKRFQNLQSLYCAIAGRTCLSSNNAVDPSYGILHKVKAEYGTKRTNVNRGQWCKVTIMLWPFFHFSKLVALRCRSRTIRLDLAKKDFASISICTFNFPIKPTRISVRTRSDFLALVLLLGT